MNFFKRLKQPSSLLGFGLLASIVPQILGRGEIIGGQVGDGINTVAGAVSQGVPWWQALLIGILSVSAVAADDKSDRE